MELKDKIKKFLEIETQKPIAGDSDNLISSGVLDSFSMMKLIGFIESDLGVKVDMEKLSPENFNSIDKITEFVQKS